MNEVVDPAHEISVSYYFSYGSLLLLSNVLPPNWPNCPTGGNGRYRDYIALAVYSSTQAIMDIMLSIPGLEKLSSGQSCNLLNNIRKENGLYYLSRIAVVSIVLLKNLRRSVVKSAVIEKKQ